MIVVSELALADGRGRGKPASVSDLRRYVAAQTWIRVLGPGASHLVSFFEHGNAGVWQLLSSPSQGRNAWSIKREHRVGERRDYYGGPT